MQVFFVGILTLWGGKHDLVSTEPGIVQFGGVTVVKGGFRQFLLRSVGCSAPFLDTARSWLHSGTGDHGQVLTREQKSIKGTLGISCPFGAPFMVMLGSAHGTEALEAARGGAMCLTLRIRVSTARTVVLQ